MYPQRSGSMPDKNRAGPVRFRKDAKKIRFPAGKDPGRSDGYYPGPRRRLAAASGLWDMM